LKRQNIIAPLAERLAVALTTNLRCRLPAIPPAAQAACVLALNRCLDRPILWVADGVHSLEIMHQDALSLAQSGIIPPPDIAGNILFFPPNDFHKTGTEKRDRENEGNRLAALRRLSRADATFIVATTIQALMQPTAAPSSFGNRCLTLKAGEPAGYDKVVSFLQQAGYVFAPEVSEPSFASVRGGIIDAWPPADSWPLRIEFEGDSVLSIRSFDPETQKSVSRLESTGITPANEMTLSDSKDSETGKFTEYLPANTIVVWSDFQLISRHASDYEALIAQEKESGRFLTLDGVIETLSDRNTPELFFGETEEKVGECFDVDFTPVEGVALSRRTALEPDMAEQNRMRFLESLRERAADGWNILIMFDTRGAQDRFCEAHPAVAGHGLFTFATGSLSGGFSSNSLHLAVISEADIYGRSRMTRDRYNPRTSSDKPAAPRAVHIVDPADLDYGDLVVHVEHGIGRYLGVSNILFDGTPQEVITVEYADEAMLHVPVSHAHLLSRYIGIAGRKTGLHRLGGKRWQTEKEAAAKAVRDFAAGLLETQAARETLEGHAFDPDTAWQHEFEAAFPYRETPDQDLAIRDVKRDMENIRPMDRLICGDAGFGKTEIAVRAAFKSVMNGKQVAMLVPTTVLCTQHFDSFTERMSAFPVRIETLSRFQTRSDRTRVLRDIRDGKADIVIGTHALIQPSVAFADLGLVIIDEEQRFGVKHKERFKLMRRMVDVLTLTATPIPRTLYLSMVGIKELSIVRTPPEYRQPVETIVEEDSDDLVRTAILREMSRDGQVYFLHNRVKSIGRVHERLRKLVPNARIAIGHGQMSPHELSEVMRDFVAGNLDVLLCTTIIESGLDISNVNTIIVDRADRFGLADLYQLRGRVGRSSRKAYACFLLPPHAKSDPSARKRVQALKRYSDLGSGFNLAMRDLELRGAGNLLGMEQSGHVAAVGFLLYCRLLGRTVARLKGTEVPPVIDVELKLDFISLSADEPDATGAALIPLAYIEEDRMRIQAYRRIAEASSPGELDKLSSEFQDRYGPFPNAVRRLMGLALMRIEAAARNISHIETRDDRLLLTLNGDLVMADGLLPRIIASSPDKKIEQILRKIRSVK